MPLWQNVLAIPTSLVIYEMDFSKQNAIKNHLWASLKLDTIDALMKVHCTTLEWIIWIGMQSLRCGEHEHQNL